MLLRDIVSLTRNFIIIIIIITCSQPHWIVVRNDVILELLINMNYEIGPSPRSTEFVKLVLQFFFCFLPVCLGE